VGGIERIYEMVGRKQLRVDKMSMIENLVAFKILQRAETGLNKYGITMERSDLTKLEWLVHAQNEALDLAVYLQKLIQEEEE